MSAADPSTAVPRLAGPLLSLLTFAAYLSTLGFEFVHFDDLTYVVRNPHLGDGLSFTTLQWAFTTSYFAWWHPLTWVSHLLDVRLFGTWAGGHHLTSAALHALNAWLALSVLRRLGLAPALALVATAAFAWHPMRVESVAWVSERKDVLSITFALLTTLAFLRYQSSPTPARYALLPLAFLAALASKVMVMTLPVTLFALGRWALPARRPLRRLALETIPLLGLSAAASAAVFSRQSHEGAVATVAAMEPLERLAGVPVALAGYLTKTVWPFELCCLYPRLPLTTGEVVGSTLLVTAVLASAVACFARTRNAGPLLGLGLFVVCVSPVLGLVQTGEQLFADRYSHLGHLALFGGLASAAPVGWLSRRPVQLAVVGALLTLFVTTVFQAQTWRDTDTLYGHALEVEPHNPPIQRRVEGLVVERALAAVELPLALQAADVLIARWPGNGRVWILAGTASATAGRYDDAVARFQRALQLEPGNQDAQRFLTFAMEDRARATKGAVSP